MTPAGHCMANDGENKTAPLGTSDSMATVSVNVVDNDEDASGKIMRAGMGRTRLGITLYTLICLALSITCLAHEHEDHASCDPLHGGLGIVQWLFGTGITEMASIVLLVPAVCLFSETLFSTSDSGGVSVHVKGDCVFFILTGTVVLLHLAWFITGITVLLKDHSNDSGCTSLLEFGAIIVVIEGALWITRGCGLSCVFITYQVMLTAETYADASLDNQD